MRIYVSIDIEATSATELCAIGMVVGGEWGEILFKKEWWFKPKREKEIHCIDDENTCICTHCRCKREFLNKNPELMELIMSAEDNAEEQIKDFVTAYDSVSEKFGVPECDIVLISDNPEFDFGQLSNHVTKYTGRIPLRYTTTGFFRKISSKSTVLKELGIMDTVMDTVDSFQKHDHRPSNDAESHYLCHLITMQILSRLRNDAFITCASTAKEMCKTMSKMFTTKRNQLEKKSF